MAAVSTADAHARRRSEQPSSTTEAIEDYAKAIFSLQRQGPEAVSTTALAERLGVSPASVSGMLKRLAELKLATHERYHGVRLTPAGEKVALEVIRHHRLLEAYLTEALDMPWDRVHAEAEVLEHYLSDELEELIADKLGYPTLDPHGDPIPNRELASLPVDETRALVELDSGERGTFTRISDSDPDMLRYLADRGIRPGLRLEVEDKQPFGGPLFVRIADDVHAIGGSLAAAMRVAVSS